MPSTFNDGKLPRKRHQETSVALPDCSPLHDEYNFKEIFALFPLQGREQEGEGIKKIRLIFCFLNVSSSRLPRISTLNKQYGARRISVNTAPTQRAGWPGLRIPVGEYLIPNQSQNGPGAQPVSTSLGIEVLPPEVKRSKRDVDHSPPTSTKVETQWSYVSTPPPCLHGA